LEALIHKDKPINLEDLQKELHQDYSPLKATTKAFIRDMNHLLKIGAVEYVELGNPLPGRGFYSQYNVWARLEWPTEITETKFYAEINKMPRAKTRLTAW